MNLEELRQELFDRGFKYLTDPRADRFLQDTYLVDICEGEDWPFLEETKEGVGPLLVTDLRTIEYVWDTVQRRKLTPMLRGRLTDDVDVDLTTRGDPQFYYVTGGVRVNTYPLNVTNKLQVRYWKVPTALAPGYGPVFAERFHGLVVDGAMVRAYQEKDNYELTREARVNFDATLEKMKGSLLHQQHDGSDDYVVITDPAAL